MKRLGGAPGRNRMEVEEMGSPRAGAPRKGSTIALLHPGAAILLPLIFSAIFILQWNNPARTPPPPTVRVSLVGFPFRRIPGNRRWQRRGLPAPENCLHQHAAFGAGERISLQQVPLQTPEGGNRSPAGFDWETSESVVSEQEDEAQEADSVQGEPERRREI